MITTLWWTRSPFPTPGSSSRISSGTDGSRMRFPCHCPAGAYAGGSIRRTSSSSPIQGGIPHEKTTSRTPHRLLHRIAGRQPRTESPPGQPVLRGENPCPAPGDRRPAGNGPGGRPCRLHPDPCPGPNALPHADRQPASQSTPWARPASPWSFSTTTRFRISTRQPILAGRGKRRGPVHQRRDRSPGDCVAGGHRHRLRARQFPGVRLSQHRRGVI